ncbi:MAG: phasin family protein [Chloroflexota bacterium]
MTEEVDVTVKEVETPTTTPNPLFEGVRRLMLASVGAVALTFDEMETFVNKLVDRGEIAQKDGENLLQELRTRASQGRPQAQVGVQLEKAEERFESGVEQVLNRLNIPSKREIDELSTKIAQLAARVEELRAQNQK